MAKKEEADDGPWTGQDALDLSAVWSMETKQSSSDPLHTCYRSNHCVRTFTLNATHTLVHICFAHFYYSSFFLFFQLLSSWVLLQILLQSPKRSHSEGFWGTRVRPQWIAVICVYFLHVRPLTTFFSSINGTLSAYFHRTNTTFHWVGVRVEIKRCKLQCKTCGSSVSLNIPAYKSFHFCSAHENSDNTWSPCKSALLPYVIIENKKTVNVLCSFKSFLSSNPNKNGGLKCTFLPMVPQKTVFSTLKLRATHLLGIWE